MKYRAWKELYDIPLTAKEIETVTGITRPTVDKFLKGDIEKLVYKNLAKMCDVCGMEITINKKPNL